MTKAVCFPAKAALQRASAGAVRRRPLAALLVLASLLAAARPALSMPPAPAVQAREAFKAANLNAAIAIWSQMINAGQNVQDSLYNRAQSYLMLRQFQLALNDLNQLELMQRPMVRSYTFLLRGIVFNELQNYGSALRDFNQAERIDGNRLVFANRAVAYQRSGQFSQAEQDLVRATKTDPSQANLHNLAAIQLSLGKFSECVKSSSLVVSAFQTFYPAYTVRGLCLYRLGRLEDSVADFLRSTTLNPAQAEASQYLGMALLSMRKSDQARSFLLRAADLYLSQNDQQRYQEVMTMLSANSHSPARQAGISSSPAASPRTPGP